MAGKLEGKVAVVTGGGSGIGAATARRFAREKATVVIADLSGTRAAEIATGSHKRAAMCDGSRWMRPTPRAYRPR